MENTLVIFRGVIMLLVNSFPVLKKDFILGISSDFEGHLNSDIEILSNNTTLELFGELSSLEQSDIREMIALIEFKSPKTGVSQRSYILKSPVPVVWSPEFQKTVGKITDRVNRDFISLADLIISSRTDGNDDGDFMCRLDY